MPDAHPDFFAPAPEDAARPGGTIRGPDGWQQGFGAGLEAWSARRNAWLPLGEVIGTGSLLLHEGRLTVSITFDLGPMPLRERRPEEADDA